MASQQTKTVVIEPKKGAHTATMVVLHGLGDTAHGWTDVAEMLHRALPHVKFVLPTAASIPVTLNMGMRCPAWYDILGLDERAKEDFEGINESKKIVDDLVQVEVDNGISSDRIVLGGFSQGAAMSLYTGFQSKHKLGGVVSLSGYLPLPDKTLEATAAGVNKDTPLLMCHGTADQVVLFKWGQGSFDGLTKAGVKGQFIPYAGMQHSACPQEIKDIEAFLKKTIPAQKAKQ